MKDVLHLIDSNWQKLDFEYEMITPGESFPDLRGHSLAVDVETMPRAHLKKAALSAFHNAVFGVSVASVEARKCWYLPVRHKAPGSSRFNLDPANAFAWLGDQMRAARLLTNGNIKFDAKTLDQEGIAASSYDDVPMYDPIIAATLIDERVPVNMQHQSFLHLGMEETKHDELEPHIVGNQDYQDWSYIPADLMARHGCGDVERAIKLSAAQRALLAREEVEDLARLEMKVCRDLIHMELRGHRVDVELLQRSLSELGRDEIIAARRIEQLVGASVNYESPKDIAEMFITRLGLPILVQKPGKNKKTGEDTLNPVFDGAVLQTYARHYPQHAELMFRMRQARRLADIKAFAQNYLEVQVKGEIHTTIKQVEARTGRESSEAPNLQNISHEERWDFPAGCQLIPMLDTERYHQNELGAQWIAPGCGKFFIAREGHAILSFDYSQIEYRLFAHYLNDERLLKAYREDATLDMHEWTAKEILEGMIERDDAKSANFGIIFNMGENKLVKYMATNGVGITEERAKAALAKYYATMPLKDLQQGVGQALTRKGFVRTILGRRRRITKFRRRWGQTRDKKGDRGLEPYQALNAICQGGAVDLLKHRSVEARQAAKARGGELILKVHDDVKIEVSIEQAETLAREVKPILERFEKPDGTPYLKLPIYVKCTSTTTSWYDAEKLGLS